MVTARRKSREWVRVIVADLSGHFSIGVVWVVGDPTLRVFRGRVTDPAGVFPFADVM